MYVELEKEQLQEFVNKVIEVAENYIETIDEDIEISTFEDEEILTDDKGICIKKGNRLYHLTIQGYEEI